MPCRPLAYDFENDPNPLIRVVSDSFMFGPQLLAAPVTDLGARTRKVVLPSLSRGEKWRSWWDDAEYIGNQTVSVAAPLDRFPLFYRGKKPGNA
jgi:alpha-D-xyloside xylohydrolase